MKDTKDLKSFSRILKHSISWILFSWFIIITASTFWNISQIKNNTLEIARIQARSVYDKDILYRRWNSMQSKVYVPVSEFTQPNPHLSEIDERDIVTPSGIQLTMINPAYMTRQVHELAQNESGIIGHITSLKPIRPNNKADEWEKKSLLRFASGIKEHSSMEIINGIEYLRFMKPLFIEESCLMCHATQDYEIGDIAGGLSVSVPMLEFRDVENKQMFVLVSAHFLLMFFGFVGIRYVGKKLEKSEAGRKQAEDELKKYNIELENKVVERTASLVEINKQLRKEIEDREQYEKELKSSESRQRSILSASFDPIICVDKNGKILFVSNSIKKVFGWDIEKINGQSIKVLIPDFNETLFIQQVSDNQDSQNGFNDFTKEMNAITKDGKIFPCDLSLSKAIDLDTNDYLYTGIIRDVTEKKKSEKLMIEKEAAEKANEVKSKFLSSMSHELRTPLNAISGYSQILLRDKNLNVNYKNKVSTILNSSEHLLSLINELLDFAKIEAHKMELLETEFELETLIEKVVLLIDFQDKQSDVEFNYEKLATLPKYVFGDDKKLKQILLNLLSNASKFTRSGGINLIIDYDYDTSNLIFKVVDTGCGIPQEKIVTMFEPFKQLDVSNINSKGTGLGLAITKELVTMMSGEIIVESKVGEGTTITVNVLLPEIEIEKTTNSENKKVITGYKGDEKKILLVDDIELNIEILNNLLEPLGFLIYIAVNGLKAVEVAKAVKPDLIIMDIVMPVLNGYEAAKRLSNDLELRDTKIVAISASVSDYNLKIARESGFIDFISKPFDIDELLIKIQEQLKIKWIYAETEDDDSQQTVINNQSDIIEIPDYSILIQIQKLVEDGNFSQIKSLILELREITDTYKAFCLKIEKLADQYDAVNMKAYIDSLIEEKK